MGDGIGAVLFLAMWVLLSKADVTIYLLVSLVLVVSGIGIPKYGGG